MPNLHRPQHSIDRPMQEPWHVPFLSGVSWLWWLSGILWRCNLCPVRLTSLCMLLTPRSAKPEDEVPCYCSTRQLPVTLLSLRTTLLVKPIKKRSTSLLPSFQVTPAASSPTKPQLGTRTTLITPPSPFPNLLLPSHQQPPLSFTITSTLHTQSAHCTLNHTRNSHKFSL